MCVITGAKSKTAFVGHSTIDAAPRRTGFLNGMPPAQRLGNAGRAAGARNHAQSDSSYNIQHISQCADGLRLCPTQIALRLQVHGGLCIFGAALIVLVIVNLQRVAILKEEDRTEIAIDTLSSTLLAIGSEATG